jgi:hypothetical protein
MRLPIVSALLLLACARGLADEPRPLPAELAAPRGERLLLRARAHGFQIYTCAPSPKQPAQLEWTLVAPEAQLVDEHDRPLGRHYAGPTWEANDGSKVVGEVVARAPRPGAIPWLLLRGKPSGAGVLAGVASIQRVDTVGGVAPASGCDGAHRGAGARVPYSAVYNFFGK